MTGRDDVARRSRPLTPARARSSHPPPAPGQRARAHPPAALIVQIDGLSRLVLERALASGHMPYLKRLLRRDAYRLEPMILGLPTSTPAFQMAAMYGVRPDIPGFHYFDRERQSTSRGEDTPRWSRPGRRPAGAASCTAAAPTAACSPEARRTTCSASPALATLRARAARGALAFVVVGWVCLKCLLRTMVELGRAIARLALHPAQTRRENSGCSFG
jgi:hypothetical protein